MINVNGQFWSKLNTDILEYTTTDIIMIAIKNNCCTDKHCNIDGDYPLSIAWNIWYVSKYSENKMYNESPKTICGFACVDTMWRWMMQKELQPGSLITGSDLFIFKSGVEPTWEDHNNKFGGRWTASMVKGIAEAWMSVYLGLIGGTLDPAGVVIGATIAKRKNYTRISVWTNDRTSPENLKIGKIIKKYLMDANVAMQMPIVKGMKRPLMSSPRLEYQDHGANYDVPMRHVLKW